jgi:outer membrane receptor for ferrienterochelin and colicins
MDVYQSNKNGSEEIKTPQFFAPRVSGTYAVSYSLDKAGITFDLTGKLNGPMHLPTVPSNGDTRPSKSPWYTLMNFQVTKTSDRGWEFYIGAKNILNFLPKDPLYYWQDPFAPQFDTSYNYAPVQGIKAFAGIRYTLQ